MVTVFFLVVRLDVILLPLVSLGIALLSVVVAVSLLSMMLCLKKLDSVRSLISVPVSLSLLDSSCSWRGTTLYSA